MKIGFSGTRHGMRTDQFMAFDKMMYAEGWKWSEFHHGDCVGADGESGDDVFDSLRGRCKVVIHPPVDETHRAHTSRCHDKRTAKTHFARNRDIVDETDTLIAAPRDMTDQDRGGTWYTIHYAQKVGKPVVIIWPDGRVERREPKAAEAR